MIAKKVLFVVTGHDRLGRAGDEQAERTGFHLSEAAEPWDVLTRAGFSVDLVTPDGGSAPIDPGSEDTDNEVNARFLGDSRIKEQITDADALADVDLDDYDAIYFPGGHGTMWDLPDHEGVRAAVRSMYESGKVVAAVCHGPAAFVNVRLSDGNWFVAGKTLSTFTDEEEKAVEKDSVVPFLLASKLKERGAKLTRASNFEKSVSIDQRIVTGQNPASAAGVGEGIRDEVNRLAAEAA